MTAVAVGRVAAVAAVAVAALSASSPRARKKAKARPRSKVGGSALPVAAARTASPEGVTRVGDKLSGDTGVPGFTCRAPGRVVVCRADGTIAAAAEHTIGSTGPVLAPFVPIIAKDAAGLPGGSSEFLSGVLECLRGAGVRATNRSAQNAIGAHAGAGHRIPLIALRLARLTGAEHVATITAGAVFR